jgi:hypothetical protein
MAGSGFKVLDPSRHGGLCLLSHSNEDFPEDIGDFLRSFLYIIHFAGRISEAPMGAADGVTSKIWRIFFD